jgi:Flp pilus assembly protein CpaB
MAIETPSRSSSDSGESGLGGDPDSSPRRTRPRAAASFLVIGLILAMGGFGLTFYLGTQLASSTPTVSVLIAAHDIQAGDTIGPTDLTTKKYLSTSAPKSVLHSTADATDHIARVDIAAGDPILTSMVGSLAQGIAPVNLYPVPPGYVAIQAALPGPPGLAAGIYVDIVSEANVALFKPGATGNVSRVVFQSIEVLVVSTPPAQSQTSTTVLVAVLVNACDLPYLDWLDTNTTLALVIEPLHQGGVTPADTTCPGLVTDHGVGATDVNARYHFTS